MNRFTRMATTFALLLFTLSLVACSSAPSESVMQEQFAKVSANPILDVKNVNKVNGREIDGSTYEATLSYDIEFKMGLQEMVNQKTPGDRDMFNMQAMEMQMTAMALKMQFGNFEKGQVVPMKAKAVFVKTENGWELDANRVEPI